MWHLQASIEKRRMDEATLLTGLCVAPFVVVLALAAWCGPKEVFTAMT